MTPSSYTPLTEIPLIHGKLVETFTSRLTFPLEFREHQLLQLARLIKENHEQLAKALSDDLGRPAVEAYQTEIAPLVQRSMLSYSQLRTWAATEDKTSLVPDWQKSWSPKVYKQPKGTALIISPWNYPVILTFQPLLGAIAAGCCAVVKPSEMAPAVSRAVKELIPKYLDTRAYEVVEGGIEETTKLLELKWDHIFYTGNGKVARIISAAAAKHLTPMTLELGGKSPVIVDPNYPDLDIAAKRILFGKHSNAGQICVAPDFCILPSKALLEPFITSLTKAHTSFFPDGLDPLNSSDYSHIVTAQHFTRVCRLLAETKGEVVFGGQTDSVSLKIAPTIVVFDSTTMGVEAIDNDSLMKEEIFGPILPLIVLDGGLRAATEFVSARDHPLVLYAFTEDSAFKEHILTYTMSGNLVFNDTFMQLSVDALPFGGVGESGHGRQILKYSFDAFSYERASIHTPLTVEPTLLSRYPPYTPEVLKFSQAMVDVDIPSTPSNGDIKANGFKY